MPESEYGDASGAGWAVDYGTDLKFGFGGHGLFGVGVGFRGNLGKVGDEETVRRAVAGEGCFSAGAAAVEVGDVDAFVAVGAANDVEELEFGFGGHGSEDSFFAGGVEAFAGEGGKRPVAERVTVTEVVAFNLRRSWPERVAPLPKDNMVLRASEVGVCGTLCALSMESGDSGHGCILLFWGYFCGVFEGVWGLIESVGRRSN